MRNGGLTFPYKRRWQSGQQGKAVSAFLTDGIRQQLRRDVLPETEAQLLETINAPLASEARVVRDALLAKQATFPSRQQKWVEQFVWNHDITQILGITAAGRATVARLRLNRPGLVNLRKALRQFGVHPPE